MAGIRDVADRAGVSLSTVSIVMNGMAEERSISSKTQDKVLTAMRELNYIPNSNAKRLRSGATDVSTIALFWSFDFRRVMMPRFLAGLTDAIRKYDSNTNVTVYPYTPGELCKQEDLLKGSQFMAAIIANADETDVDFLDKLDTPVRIILYNRNHTSFSSVNLDNTRIGQIAAEHLFEQGYRAPRVIYGTRSYNGANEREKAFCDWMTEHGIAIGRESFTETENSVDGGAECARQLLQAGKDGLPDSAFCASDAIAIGFANVMTQNGVRVPEDLGIIAIGNGEPQYSRCNNPSITVVNIPMEDMAAAAYEIFHDARFDPGFKRTTRSFEAKLIRRTSTDRTE